MTLSYCTCEHPLIDVEHDAGCRRCGRPVDFTPAAPNGAWPMRVDTHPAIASLHVDRVSELEARRVERVASLEGSSPPAWGDETGSVDVRLVAITAVIAAAVLVVVLLWKVIAAGVVLYAAYRHLTRHTRRRRPKSSWSSLATSGAALFAAWNSRWLKTTIATPAGKPLRVSVPAAAGRDHRDEYGEIPF